MKKMLWLTAFVAISSTAQAEPNVVVLHNDRIVATSDGSQHHLFSYDPVGNLSSETCLDSEKRVLEQKDYFYSDTAQLQGIKNAHDGTELNFEHDSYGRLIRKGNQSFEYNAYNMMTSFANNDVEASYSYDPRTGLRASKTVNGQTTRFIYDDAQRVVQELGQDGQTLSQVIYGEHSPQTYIYQGQMYTYDLNSLGSVIALRNAEGEVVNRYAYDVWGRLESSQEQIPNAIRYRGEYQDSETGFYDLKGRYYDPEIRQFTTMDPAEDGLNWNIYCDGNPWDYVDPSGYLKFAVQNPGQDLFSDIYYTDADLDSLRNSSDILASLGSLLSPFINAGAGILMSMITGPKIINEAIISSMAQDAKSKNCGLRVMIHKNVYNQPTYSTAEYVDKGFVEQLFRSTPCVTVNAGSNIYSSGFYVG